MNNESKLIKCGLDKYHANGLDGKGITVAILDEQPYIRSGIMDPSTYITPVGVGKSASHATNVAQVIHEAAPGATIVMLPFMNTADRIASIAWLRNNHVDIINISLNLATADSLYPDLEALHIPIVAAAGNNGPDTRDCAKPACFDWTISVGGFSEGTNDIYSENSYGDSMDCVTYTNIFIETRLGYVVPFGGTSAAAPWLCGMLACYYTGRKVDDVQTLKKLIKENCTDIREPGKDRSSGWGFFNMPEIQQNVPKPSTSTTIIMKIGSKEATVNGKSVVLDCMPKLENDRTLVPIRFVAEALGCTVDYKSGTITIIK